MVCLYIIYHNASLWCNITSTKLKTTMSVRGRCQECTLKTLKSDHDSFEHSGGDIKKARFHHNVIWPLFLTSQSHGTKNVWNLRLCLPSAVHQVCVPGLHISLEILIGSGFCLKVLSWSWTSCWLITLLWVLWEHLDKYVLVLNERKHLKLALQLRRTLEQLVTYLTLQLANTAITPSLNIIRQEASKARLSVAAMV